MGWCRAIGMRIAAAVAIVVACAPGGAVRGGAGSAEVVERAVERYRTELDATGLRMDPASVTRSFVLTTTLPLEEPRRPAAPPASPDPSPAVRRELITEEMLRPLRPGALRLEEGRKAAPAAMRGRRRRKR